jgi:glutathione S-transferase
VGAVFQGLPEGLLLYRRHESNYTNDMSGADAIKTRVRELLMPVFFPKLRGDEVRALLDGMREQLPTDAKALEKCLAAIDKALKERRSFVQEDRLELAGILGAVCVRVRVAQALDPADTQQTA